MRQRQRILCGQTMLCFTVVLSGCGVLGHLIGVPETPPPLDRVASALLPLATTGDASIDDRAEALSPARGATEADLAGIWVHGDGLAAVHIDRSGWVYQIDRAEDFDGLPDGIPTILFNVGNVSVGTDGFVSADLAASILGISASAKVTGILDDTFSTIFAATTEFRYDLGQGPETTRDFAPWFRWTE